MYLIVNVLITLSSDKITCDVVKALKSKFCGCTIYKLQNADPNMYL